MLKLLSQDVADIDPALLDRACQAWARNNRFMPKASELRELAEGFAAQASTDTRTLAERYNERLTRTDVVWINLPEGGVRLVPRHRRGEGTGE